jgi:hypothetical protein
MPDPRVVYGRHGLTSTLTLLLRLFDTAKSGLSSFHWSAVCADVGGSVARRARADVDRERPKVRLGLQDATSNAVAAGTGRGRGRQPIPIAAMTGPSRSSSLMVRTSIELVGATSGKILDACRARRGRRQATTIVAATCRFAGPAGLADACVQGVIEGVRDAIGAELPEIAVGLGDCVGALVPRFAGICPSRRRRPVARARARGRRLGNRARARARRAADSHRVDARCSARASRQRGSAATLPGGRCGRSTATSAGKAAR